MDFFFFLLVNATLFIRPAEVIPDLATVPVYQITILTALLATVPKVLSQLTRASLAEHPVTACVLLMMAAMMLSHLVRFDTWTARMVALDFIKVVLYYLLLLASIDRPSRLYQFLYILMIMIAVPTLLAVLEYHGAIDIPAITLLDRDGLGVQLRATGILNDPNDLALVLVMGIVIGIWSAFGRNALMRLLGLAAIGFFGYALVLTKSRGGFLSLLVALTSILIARFGWKRALPLAIMMLPAMLALFGGRQTELSTGADTAQQRLQFWSQGFQLFRQEPLFGIGVGNFEEEIRHVAHNSYVQAYVETGYLGGSLFVGLFYLTWKLLQRVPKEKDWVADPALLRIYPYCLAILCGYATGLYSLTRNYIVLTYLVLGLPEAYQRIALCADPEPGPRLSGALLQRVYGIGFAVLAFLYIFTRVSVRWG